MKSWITTVDSLLSRQERTEVLPNKRRLSRKHPYTCLLYTSNVEGTLTNETYATDSYSATQYRRVSLPLYIPAPSTSEGYSVIKSGNNVLAICLVARTASQRTSTFDASLHIMGRETVGRVFDYTATTSDSAASANYAFDLSGQTVYSSTSCNEGRFIQITFENDRREWISRCV